MKNNVSVRDLAEFPVESEVVSLWQKYAKVETSTEAFWPVYEVVPAKEHRWAWVQWILLKLFGTKEVIDRFDRMPFDTMREVPPKRGLRIRLRFSIRAFERDLVEMPWALWDMVNPHLAAAEVTVRPESYTYIFPRLGWDQEFSPEAYAAWLSDKRLQDQMRNQFMRQCLQHIQKIATPVSRLTTYG